VTGPPLAQYCLRRRWAQVAVERLLGWGPAGGARRLEQAGRPADAEKALGLPPERTELWPHVQVRVDLAFGAALAALSRTDEAQRSLQRALAISEANGLRTFQLAAHRALIGVVEDAAAKDRHEWMYFCPSRRSRQPRRAAAASTPEGTTRPARATASHP
jgi:hypothetical protein